MTFRLGMSNAELAAELVSAMDEFRPQVAELMRDALRWQFCLAQREFPEQSMAGSWTMRCDDGCLYFGTTAVECIDRAMAALQQRKG